MQHNDGLHQNHEKMMGKCDDMMMMMMINEDEET